jgi:capsular polysaccharide biosynthesis protein
MSNEADDSRQIRSPKLPVFLRVFFALFFTSVAVSVLISYLMPETYESRVVLKWEWDGSEHNYEILPRYLEFLRSDAFLQRVAAKSLKERGETRQWQFEELRDRITITPVRGFVGIGIAAFGPGSVDAFELANLTGEACLEVGSENYNREAGGRYEIYLRAEIEPRPISPNKPRNMGKGALVGLLLGALGGGTVVQLRRRIENRGAPA